MKIFITYGRAGTGKTHELVKLVRELYKTKSSFVVLAPTHNAVNNIFQRLGSKESIKKRLMTIHAYFRINYKNDNKMLGPKCLVEHIIIDEFSLMHRNIYIQILALLEARSNITLHLFGDPLQLNAVYDSPVDNLISFSDMLKYDSKAYSEQGIHLTVRQIKHIHQSNFYNNPLATNQLTINQLTVNHRANDTVMQILNALLTGDASFNYNIISKFVLKQKLKEHNTYFLASNYEVLQQVYDSLASEYKQVPGYTMIKQYSESTAGFRTLHLYPGCLIRCLDNSNNYYNGQVLAVELITSTFIKGFDINTNEEVTVECVDKIFPIGPSNLLTVHKSQGYTLENVIVCFDKMFELSMLYTAVTRASQTLSFYTAFEFNVNKLIEAMHGDELEQLSKFHIL